ncbi:MAG: SpaA isopeptide-forming pilin-related protein [Acutalibacteraceae bacterium]
MTGKARSHDVLGKLSAFSMAVIVLLSIFVPTYASTIEASAAAASTNNGEVFKIHLNSEAEDYWQAPMQVRFLDDSGNVLKTQSIDGLTTTSVVEVSAPAGATKIAVDKLNSKSGIVDKINNELKPAAASNQTLVLMDSTRADGSTLWSNVYYYVWNGANKNADWPGQQISTKIDGTNVYYTYVDPTEYPNIIFNNSSGSQTGDLQTPSVGSNKIFYSSVANGFVDYTTIAIEKTVSLSVSDRTQDGKNHLYLTGDKTAKWSKYGDTIDVTTIYFKPSANWEYAYVAYDDDDPFSTTVQMTQYNENPLIFTAQVPVGAKLTFADGTGAGVTQEINNVTYDGNENKNTYIMSSRQWDTLDNAMTIASDNVDWTIGNNFPSNVFGAKATYYDYLSDHEIENKNWRDDAGAGTNGDKNNQFSRFNAYLSQYASEQQTATSSIWGMPLYFGNFYSNNSNGWYNDGPYESTMNSLTHGYNNTNDNWGHTGLPWAYYASQNSNYLALSVEGDKTTDGYHRAYMGLVSSTLKNGELYATDKIKAPWFYNDLLKPTTGQVTWQAGKYFKIAIPKDSTNFQINPGGDSNKYEFDFTNFAGKIFKTDGTHYTGSDQTSLGVSSSDDNYYYLVIDNSDSWSKICVHYWGGTNTSTWPGVEVTGDIKYISDSDSSIVAKTQYAKIISSQFPFVKETDPNTGVTTYSFSSATGGSDNGNVNCDPYDNVYFTWDNGAPQAVQYSRGSANAVKDGTGSGLNYWNGTSGCRYGIFPFNNGTNGTPDKSLDFGFGIEMEMEFTLPKNGVYDDITYTVSGPTTDQFYIKPENPDATKFYLHIWTNETDGEEKEITQTIKDANGVKYFVVNSSDLGNKTNLLFKSSGNDFTHKSNNTTFADLKGKCWNAYEVSGAGGDNNSYALTEASFTSGEVTEEGESAKFNYSGDDDIWVFIDGQLVLDLGGNHKKATGSIDFGSSDGKTIKSTANSVSYVFNNSTNSADYKNGAAVEKTVNIDTTDPTYKHKMKIFYLERGLLESNLSVSYTIQPVENDLTVAKTVVVPELNSGIANAVTNAVKNSDFGFTLTKNSTAYSNSYILTKSDNTKETKSTTDGSFSLKQDYSASFTKDLKYNDSISLSETAPSMFEYSTYYTVKDNKTGYLLHDSVQTGTSTSFDMKNKLNGQIGDPDSGASVYAECTNTLKTAALTLDKVLKNEDGSDSSNNVPFEFTVELDLDGDGAQYDYQTYDLEYEIINNNVASAATYTAEGGKLSIRPDQTAKFINLPVGAKYRITETSKTGYTQIGVSGGPTGTIIETGAAVTFTNRIITGSANLSAYKKLNDEVYANGDKFNFKAELVDVINIPDVTDKDETALAALKTAHPYTSTAGTTDTNGLVVFDSFSIGVGDEESARYVFEIIETAPDTEVAGQYITDNSIYYACIDVSGGAVKLPNYYKTYANKVLSEPVNSAKPTTAPTFYNRNAGVDISFTKTDENGVSLQGAEFTLYSNSECTEKVENDATGTALVNPVTSGSDGRIQFTKIAPGTYYIKETKAPNGYQLLMNPVTLTVNTDQTFTLAGDSMLSGDAENGYYVKNFTQPELPSAGGIGTTMFYVIGGLIVALSAFALVLYKKRISLFALANQLVHRK